VRLLAAGWAVRWPPKPPVLGRVFAWFSVFCGFSCVWGWGRGRGCGCVCRVSCAQLLQRCYREGEHNLILICLVVAHAENVKIWMFNGREIAFLLIICWEEGKACPWEVWRLARKIQYLAFWYKYVRYRYTLATGAEQPNWLINKYRVPYTHVDTIFKEDIFSLYVQ
jgi:hypothetical protein